MTTTNAHGKRRLLAASGLLLVLTLAAYFPALDAGFIWDDDAYLTDNRTLRSARGLGRIWSELGATPQYYPMVFTSFWVERRLWGLEPTGYHAVNMVLHALNALLVFWLLRRLGLRGAWLAAALFAVHPVHVESVAWITERKNVLSGCFYLAAFLVYARYRGIGPGPEREEPQRGRWPLYLLALVLFLLALLAKTVTCSLPAAILLVSYWKYGRIRRKDVLPLVPFFSLGLLLALVTSHMEKTVVGARGEPWQLDLAERLLVAGRALWFYAGKLIWPRPFVFNYPRWTVDTSEPGQWLYPLSALALLVLAWALRRRLGRGPLVALLFFGGTLLPALGFFDVYPMLYSWVADHFQYLASLGLLALGAAGLERLAGGGRLRVPVRVAMALVLVGLGALTWRQCLIYRNPVTLWRHTIAHNPASWMGHTNLARHLVAAGRYLEAAEHLRVSLEVNPRDALAHINLGNLHARQRRFEEAERHYQAALSIDPRLALAHFDLGQLALSQGRARTAEAHLREALRLEPGWPRALDRLAWSLAEQAAERPEAAREAMALANEACARTGFANTLFLQTLAVASARAGDTEAAVEALRRALTVAEQRGQEDLAARIRERLGQAAGTHHGLDTRDH